MKNNKSHKDYLEIYKLEFLETKKMMKKKNPKDYLEIHKDYLEI